MTTSIHSSLSSSHKSFKRHILAGDIAPDCSFDLYIQQLKIAHDETSKSDDFELKNENFSKSDDFELNNNTKLDDFILKNDIIEEFDLQNETFSSSSSFPSSDVEDDILHGKPQSTYLSISMPAIHKVTKVKSYDNYSSLKMFVFDCDNMITRLSLVNIDISDILDMPLERIVEDPKFFVQCVNILTSNEYKVSIASYGFKDKILILMQRLFSEYSEHPCPFDKNNIITPLDLCPETGPYFSEISSSSLNFPKLELLSCGLCNHPFSKSFTTMPSTEWKEGYEPPMGKGKWLMLEKICEKFHLLRHQVILLDDSVTNCFQAIANGYNAKVVKNISRKRHLPNLKDENFTPEEFLSSWKVFIQDMSY